MLVTVLFLSLVFGTYFFRAYRRQLKINKALTLEKEKFYVLNETKNHLLSVLSHDLRPSVYKLKELNMDLKSELLHDEKKHVHLLINKNIAITNTAYSLLDTMLHWVLEETGRLFFKPEKLHLKSLINQVCFDFIPFLELKKIGLTKRIAPDVFVYADANTLKIAIRNVLENALKYTPDKGTIKIYTVPVKGLLQLVIADSGVGMDTAALENIFSIHHKTRKKDINGNLSTGLGLQLVKTMVEKNGGTVVLKSKPDKGTKIIITLKHIV